MAEAVGKVFCVKCGKEKAAYKCEGCSQHFCFNHLTDHHQSIGKQLDDIEDKRNHFREILNEQKNNLEKHSLIQQINQWEYESIQKIQQTANEARLSLSDYINQHIDDMEMKLNKLTEQMKQIREENDFNEIILNKLKERLIKLEQELAQPSNIVLRKDASSFIRKISVVISSSMQQLNIPNISINVKWIQKGITVAGGNGRGDRSNQLSSPWSLYVDDDQTIYVADYSNHRITQWKDDGIEIVIGKNGKGNQNDQLSSPANVVIDKKNDFLIISDYGNRRVVQWSRQNGTKGETIISNIACWGLAMDNNGYFYISDIEKQEVRRWKIGEKNGTLVAGGNGAGNRLDQFDDPRFIFVDQDQSVYVSDGNNHRIMKWLKDAKEGIVVAGGQDHGNSLSQLFNPGGIIVDQLRTIYIADYDNHRVMRWLKGATQGNVVVGGKGPGEQANQLNGPIDLSFDKQNNLYVLDNRNCRVQKFQIEQQ